jgi:beta-lactamase class C
VTTTTAELTARIDRLVVAQGVPGAGMFVARHGRTVFEHYAGEASPGVPASPDSLWPLASISKLYTAAMVMRLVELGELTLNTLVCAIVPRFTGEGRELVRLRHLLTHTSGLAYESPQMGQRLAARTPLSEMLDEAIASPLLFRPGTGLSYSDYGYLLAGHAAEVATGRSFVELVQSLVLDPMGLRDTYFAPPPAVEGRIAVVRGVLAEGTDGAMYNTRAARDLAHPAFGTIASLPDLLRFASHFAPGGPRVLAEATVRAMTRDQSGGVIGEHFGPSGHGPGSRVPWGFGFELQTPTVPASLSELASLSAFGHGGASGCQLLVDPELGLIVTFVSNAHLLLDPEAWFRRIQAMTSAAIATFGPT